MIEDDRNSSKSVSLNDAKNM